MVKHDHTMLLVIIPHARAGGYVIGAGVHIYIQWCPKVTHRY